MIELTRNSRTGGYDVWAIQQALIKRGVTSSLVMNARSEGYGVADVLTVDPTGQEEKLTANEWRLLAAGFKPK